MDGLYTRFLKVLANLLTKPLKIFLKNLRIWGDKKEWRTNVILIIFKS